eukprot:TRINITY_DN24392_c0_g1_i1.p1 TRINITY_DN24392_c0_g1~~TRINITY_DN24392_c0_g1_i1.p1  ORF type:complete len:557 (+),score=142.00 TRINITY_DN24392_c0_g1_i1:58-1671(+)
MDHSERKRSSDFRGECEREEAGRAGKRRRVGHGEDPIVVQPPPPLRPRVERRFGDYATRKFDGTCFYRTRCDCYSGSRRDESVPIEEILDSDFLERALVSTFTLDEEWLFSQFRPDMPLVLVRHWDRDEETSGVVSTHGGRITIVRPPMLKFGTMHAKLMILRYIDFVRIVISSSNLGDGDYKVIGQVFWAQDFELVEAKNGTGEGQHVHLDVDDDDSEDRSEDFLIGLNSFLNDMGVPPAIVQLHLKSVHIEKVRIELVASVPGYHNGSRKSAYGHMRLRSLISHEESRMRSGRGGGGWDGIDRDDQIVYQCSSFGKLDRGFVNQFLTSIGISELDVPRRRAIGNPSSASSGGDDLPFAVVYPTQEEAISSPSGLFGMSVCCLSPEHWNMSTFPRHWFCPTHVPEILHSKVLARLAMRPSPSSGTTSLFGWIYIGSHNFSPSAWGRLIRDDNSLQMFNYELGVWFPHKMRNREFFDASLPFHFPLISCPKSGSKKEEKKETRSSENSTRSDCAYQEGERPFIMKEIRLIDVDFSFS